MANYHSGVPDKNSSWGCEADSSSSFQRPGYHQTPTSNVRPLPRNLRYFRGQLRRCSMVNCRGPRCTFAHNEAELKKWTEQIQKIHKPLRNLPLQSESHQSIKEDYAASRVWFKGRIKEILDPAVIKAPLTRTNYKKKFHHQICWEEQSHIETLGSKCNGEYSLVLYQSGQKPQWIYNRNEGNQRCVRYGYLEGITADQVAYISQSSEAAFIIGNGNEIRINIMKENFNHSDEHLYVGFTREGMRNLNDLIPDLPRQKVTYNHMQVQFEVKHSYFNNLIRSINNISDEVIKRLLPDSKDFLPKISSAIDNSDQMSLVSEQLDTEDQLNALRAIALYPPSSPPILINGSFGTGKSRVLAIATYFIIESSSDTNPARVLVCAHHQASADHFVETYFGGMMQKHSWKARHLFRVTSPNYFIRSEKLRQFSEYFLTPDKLEAKMQGNKISDGSIVIATTFLTALRLSDTFPHGFFTHILLDEGAQSREPEAVAPLSLASAQTQIVIAGDSNQVGPALLVLGQKARNSGLRLSLLERLQIVYRNIGDKANGYTSTLSTNYRCHEDIVAIPHQLFYSGLKSKAHEAIPHPQAPYPLLFVCSNLSSNVCSSDLEAQLLMEQVNKFIGRHWPRQCWGKYDINKIAIVTATRTQLVITRKLCRSQFKKFQRVRLLPCYDIQGQEFQAVFLSTAEPIDAHGNTCNPTKSPCDRYVFNTVLTRAKSLVVVVGSPLVLLSTEVHMVKQYGDKGKCWSLYLRACLEHNTFIIPPSVGDYDQGQKFKAKLSAQLETLGTISATPVSIAGVAPASMNFVAKLKSGSLPSVAQPRPKNSREVDVQSDPVQPQIRYPGTDCSVKQVLSDEASSNKSLLSGAISKSKTAISMNPLPHGKPHRHAGSQINKSQLASPMAWPTGKASAAAKSLPLKNQHPSKQGKRKNQAKFEPPVINIDSSVEFPSLEEARKVPVKRRIPHQQPKVLSEAHSVQNVKLDMKVLKEELTRKNYIKKFHHLLRFEEQEHQRILDQKCNDEYRVTFFSPRDPPYIFEDKDSDCCRYGIISGENGDNLAYAKQASEGSLIILNENVHLNTEHVRARIPPGRDYNPNSIIFGLSKNEVEKLIKWKPATEYRHTYPISLQVKFMVKRLYFNGLHVALSRLKLAGILKMIPLHSDFTSFTSESFMPGPPPYQVLNLDSCQQRALFRILNCSSGAPVLVTGPFGTGKTRLLVRAAYEILKSPRNRVFMCAHHQNSVDTFINYFGEISQSTHKPWQKKVVRVVLSRNYINNNKPKHSHLFVARDELESIDSYDLVTTTLGTSHTLLYKSQKAFTHILIDEGAQTREPETISPLCFARKYTKVVIAGDHLQVGPRVLVLGKEAQEHGLGTSLLERLHAYYVSNDINSVAKDYSVSLLTNYRCHSGILMLPSSLFYGSTLQCRAEQMSHPFAPFPLQFICSSINRMKSNSQGKDEDEAQILLEQVTKYVSNWPSHIWNEKHLGSICIMTPSADQYGLIIRKLHRDFKSLDGVTVLKSDDIQGREFRAVFIGTSDSTFEDGSPQNPTKTVFDPFIFNTAITRSKSLVVAVGNPFLILNIEKQMEKTHGGRAKCWSQFMKQCLECNTFHFSNESKQSIISKEAYNDCRNYLHDELFCDFKTRIEIDNSEIQGDSILKAYQEEVEKISEYKKAKLTLARASKADLSWIMNEQDSLASEPPEAEEKEQDEDEDDYVEKYDCVLNFSSYREAKAEPIDPKKKVVVIRGSGNRIGAFDGDTFEVGVFHDNPDGKCYGRALKLRERGSEATFICRVSHHNPVMFYPVDRKNSKFINLPRISKDLLQKRDKDAVKAELKSTDVVVFDHHAISSNSEELKIPPIHQVIPHSVAKDMLFIVAYLRWKKPYRFPLGIVIGVLPKGHTAFSAERLLKVKHSVEYAAEDTINTNENVINIVKNDEEPFFGRAFTIDPDGAQNLDDAISLIKLPMPSQDEPVDGGSAETYQLGVHIVNCARYIKSDGDIDLEAKKRGISVYGGRERKIMQMLPAEIREGLSLLPNKIRDVLSVIATVSIDSHGISITDIEIKEAQIMSCIQLTYMSAQKVMNGKTEHIADDLTQAIHQFDCQEDQPSLSMTLQLLYRIALTLKKKRLQSDAAHYYDINESEDSFSWQTHMLIAELMIWANSKVAEKIHENYPDTALLRRQPEPNSDTMKDFTDKHKEVASMSLNLSSLVRSQQEIAEDQIFVLTNETLLEIRNAISSGDEVHLISLLFSDRYYPQLASVRSQLQLCQHPAKYCCTDRKNNATYYHHYSLQLDHYTHFSSPLRRYIDIEVQRMLIQPPKVSNSSTPPQKLKFSQSEHQSLCSHLNRKHRNARQFEKNMKSVELALKYSCSSEVCSAFIANNSKGSIEFCFPQLDLKDISPKERTVPLKFLGPYANVKEEDLVSMFTSDDQGFQTFHWKVQMTSFSAEQGAFIFNVPNIQIQSLNDSAEDDAVSVEIFTANSADPNDFTLSTVKYNATTSKPLTLAIPFDQWKKAIDFVKNPTLEKMNELDKLLPALTSVIPEKKTKLEITKSSPFINCHYQTCFKPHNVIRMWMTRSMRESLIAPAIQIVEVNPLMRICVQHSVHPAECFSDQNLSKASRKYYSSIAEYVHTWEKVLLAEAAGKSVKECRQVIIHDAILAWPQLVVPTNCIDEEYFEPMGSISLTLPQNYVENCSEFIQFNEGDLMCVRYGLDAHLPARAVFHMVIHKINYNRDDETKPMKVMMKIIGDSNRRISEEVKPTLESKCELQLISLSTSYQRVYQGLQKLLDMSNESKSQKPASRNQSSRKARDIGKLVEFVALGKEIDFNVSQESTIATKVFREYPQAMQLWGIPHQTVMLNRVQRDAAYEAFIKPFQLIQGPPGTGKSETGAHIAFTFAMTNRQLGSPQKCVLYCGPSNKSVDVVLEKLNKLCSRPNNIMDLKILRIYGRAVETRDFPGPDSKGKVDQSAKSEYTCPEWAQKYALHHKIREGHHATNLRELEEKLGSLPEGSIADGQMRKKYRRALLEAEEATLAEQEFDIVLCTCNEASSKRVLKCVFPRQCIVDECGMAYEPECIAPLELCDHAVLLGDHKQLQPVIDYAPARENGLSISLFQRYAENFEASTRTLTIQYRMHEEICEFPSQQFYKGELKTADSVKNRTNSETKLDEFWPGPKKSRCPILFCNVVGKEGDYETGSKAVGGKKIGIGSKFNQKEAQKVVDIVKVLCRKHKVRTSCIAVLTPYSAQKNLIEEKMKKEALHIKVASIIESQGDEYGIVILSTVRSLPIKEIANEKHVQADRGWLLENLGFLTDEHQLNVGITRSKYGLVIVGNKKLLTYDNTWKALIKHYEDRGCCVEGDRFC